MRIKLCFVVFFLLMSIKVYSQNNSKWNTEEDRKLNYPAELYYTSYIVGNLRTGEKESDLLMRIKQSAISELSSNIRSRIKGEKTMRQGQYQKGSDYINELYVNTYSNLSYENLLVDIHVESYFDPVKLLGYAFAWVNKENLAAYYKNQLSLYLSSVSSLLNSSKVALSANQKTKAKELCMSSIEPLAKAEQAQDLITVVIPDATTEDLRLDAVSQLKESIMKQLMDCDQGASVYVDCEDGEFENEVIFIRNKIEGLMTDNGYSIIADKELADFILKIKLGIKEHEIKNEYVKFVYANVVFELINTYNNLSICKDQFNAKGGGITVDMAIEDALKAIVPLLWKEISSSIQN